MKEIYIWAKQLTTSFTDPLQMCISANERLCEIIEIQVSTT